MWPLNTRRRASSIQAPLNSWEPEIVACIDLQPAWIPEPMPVHLTWPCLSWNNVKMFIHLVLRCDRSGIHTVFLGGGTNAVQECKNEYIWEYLAIVVIGLFANKYIANIVRNNAIHSLTEPARECIDAYLVGDKNQCQWIRFMDNDFFHWSTRSTCNPERCICQLSWNSGWHRTFTPRYRGL